MSKENRTVGWALVCLLLFVTMVSAQEAAPESGNIAYVGSDYNIYLFDPNTARQSQLTDDAGESRRYQWPTWSTDGRLAYFSSYLDDGRLFLGAHISQNGFETGRQVYAGENEGFNYAYWAPQDCAFSAGCRDLTVLISSQSKGMFLELLRDAGDETSNETVGLGGPPFYYSWSPDGSRMIWQRRNETLDIYDTVSAEVIDTLDQTPGAILAPAWSPVDDRILLGARDDDSAFTDLVIFGDGEVLTLAQDLNGLVSFSWSPNGNYAAYRVASGSAAGPIFVVDASTGELVARSPVTGALAFFWSPDSQRIAYITLASPPGSFSAHAGGVLAAPTRQDTNGIAWSILNIGDESVVRFGAFVPTGEMIYILQYFDQFAQSHRVWSPDSRHLIFSEMTEDGPMINLLDVTQADSVPFAIAAGLIGVWSFN